jgi:hypothetical protein
MSAEKKSRTIHRLPPCPSYDVEGTESWLSHMAEEGFHLARDGFFAGLATFEEGKPAKVRYRLEAAPKGTSIFSDNGGEPDPEAVALCRELGWEYVAVRGDFYVYRSSLPGARELNTDPAVQAMVLSKVRKRRRAAFLNLLLWFVLYPLLTFATGPLLTMIQMGTWFMLLGVLLFLWVLRDSLRELLWLRKLEKKLLAGQPLDHRSGSWKRRTRRHPLLSLLQLLLLVLWVGALLWDWGVSASDANRVPLEEYQGHPPFATLADLVGEGELFRNMSGMGFNTVLEW